MGISRDKLELFAIQAVKDTLADPSLIRSLERQIRFFVANKPQRLESKLMAVQKTIAEKEHIVSNLTNEIALGNRSEAIRRRLEDVEGEKTTRPSNNSYHNNRLIIMLVLVCSKTLYCFSYLITNLFRG